MVWSCVKKSSYRNQIGRILRTNLQILALLRWEHKATDLATKSPLVNLVCTVFTPKLSTYCFWAIAHQANFDFPKAITSLIEVLNNGNAYGFPRLFLDVGSCLQVELMSKVVLRQE